MFFILIVRYLRSYKIIFLGYVKWKYGVNFFPKMSSILILLKLNTKFIKIFKYVKSYSGPKN